MTIKIQESTTAQFLVTVQSSNRKKHKCLFANKDDAYLYAEAQLYLQSAKYVSVTDETTGELILEAGKF